MNAPQHTGQGAASALAAWQQSAPDETIPRVPAGASFGWRAGFHGYDRFGIHADNSDWLAGKAERDRLLALGVEVETWC